MRHTYRADIYFALLLLMLFSICPISLVGLWHSVTYCSAQQPTDKAIPPEGATLHDTLGRVPGDPTKAMSDLKRIYEAISYYRSQHGGEYPPDVTALTQDIAAHVQDYGFKDFKEGLNLFTNPDSLYAEDPVARRVPKRVLIYHISNKRPDVSLVGSPKQIGTRDVLAWTELYVHLNIRNFGENRTTINPVGFYIVLWDDGQVNKIPYEEMLMVPRGGSRFVEAFSGQAGVPFNALTFDEFYGRFIATELRGKPVPEHQIMLVPDNGGPEALITLSRLYNIPIERDKLWAVFESNKEDFSLPEIQNGSAKLGLLLTRQSLSIENLQHIGFPVLLRLHDPDRIVTLAALSSQDALIYDGGLLHIVDNDILRQRYTGESLIPSQMADKLPSLTVDTPVQITAIKQPDEIVTKKVAITNRGSKELSLQAQSSGCGCTQIELSSNTLAPGQTATLTATFKWRELVGGPTQASTLILHANDPLVPRLTLGFQLKLAKP